MRNLGVLLLSAVLAWGCGGSSSKGTDAGPDAVPDALADALPDAGADLPAPGDTPSETATDIPADVPVDVSGDVPADAPMDTPVELPFQPWATYDDAPPVAGGWFDGHPELREFLAFRYHWRPGTPRPGASFLGDFGIGNGRVFTELGLAFPLNTLHNMIGPTYSRRDKFYVDLAMLPGDAEGKPGEFEEEWIGWTRITPAVVTVGRVGDRHVQTVDFAPRPGAGEGARAVHGAVWRRVVVRNAGSAALAASSLVLKAAASQVTDADTLMEPRQDGKRLVFSTAPGAKVQDGNLVVPVPAVEPGQAWEADVVFLTAAPDADLAAARAQVAAEDPAALLAATVAAYAGFEQDLAQVVTPDATVNDFFVSLKRMLWTQISAQGASSPLSRYTMTWIRDQSGSVRALLAFGAHALARGVLDYFYVACAMAGQIADALEADLPIEAADPPVVDWENLPKFEHFKTLAESTSHLPLLHAWVRAATGEDEYVRGRLPYLRHAIFGQTWSAEGLQPFSDDETYRAAMNVAFGLDLEYPHHLKNYALTSSLLMASASTALADLEQAVPVADRDAAWQGKVDAEKAMAALATKAVKEGLALPDGCSAAYREVDGGKLSPPFEDASLMGPWAGAPWDTGAEAGAVIECLDKHVKRGPGDYRSGMAEQYAGLFDLYDGTYTGMLPGYTLRTLVSAGHPDAETAFHLLRRSLSPAGQYAEYVRGDDHAALEPLYDPQGGLGDYTARFRPWEGGINLEAALFYLAGFVPDAPRSRVAFRPHLPTGWPSFTVTPLSVGPTRVLLQVRRADAGIEVAVIHLAGPAATVGMTWDAYGGKAPVVTANGTIVDEALPCEMHFGTCTVALPDCALDAGGTCVWTFG